MAVPLPRGHRRARPGQGRRLEAQGDVDVRERAADEYCCQSVEAVRGFEHVKTLEGGMALGRRWHSLELLDQVVAEIRPGTSAPGEVGLRVRDAHDANVDAEASVLAQMCEGECAQGVSGIACVVEDE